MNTQTNTTALTQPQRKLSFWRVMVAISLISGLIAGGVFGRQHLQAARSADEIDPWFAAYVDVTATPTFAFEQMGELSSARNAVLSFIVADSKEACTPSWGGAFTLDQAAVSLDLDRRIARLQQQDGSIAVSFGGLLNDELAITCSDPIQLAAAYESVVERYDIDTIDLDLENAGLSDLVAAERRAQAIAKLQTKRREDGKNLAVWATIPVAAQGLTEDGINAISVLLNNGVDLAGVNVMTMNYGQSKTEDQSMFEASESALNETHRQLGVLYQLAGINLSSATLWTKIGATPMIGQNDIAGEIFNIEDAKKLNQFAQDRGMARLSMWSANRDRACGGNYVDVQIVSDSCSGIDQEDEAFAVELSNELDGNLETNSGVITTDEQQDVSQKIDDPATSPYQIWSKSGRYLQGTKVVWRQNVYEAKWWTQGDQPDNPVLQTWETPWKLIGPVLPGETPVKQATLPAGTYSEWSGEDVYDAGARILFEGVPYQSKWWTQGDSPAAASSNPDSSPWVPLTQAQIEEILETL